MRLLRYSLLLPIALLLCVFCMQGCSKFKLRDATPQQFSKDGVQFTHQTDWEITKDHFVNDNPDVRSITIKGPDNALLMILVLSPKSALTLESYASNLAKNRDAGVEKRLSLGSVKLGENTDETSGPVVRSIAGKDRTGIHQTFNLQLLNVTVPHDVLIFMLQGAGHKAILMYQVPNKHFDSSNAALDLILGSLAVDGAN
jgi:hypothetical protein